MPLSCVLPLEMHRSTAAAATSCFFRRDVVVGHPYILLLGVFGAWNRASSAWRQMFGDRVDADAASGLGLAGHLARASRPRLVAVQAGPGALFVRSGVHRVGGRLFVRHGTPRDAANSTHAREEVVGLVLRVDASCCARSGCCARSSRALAWTDGRRPGARAWGCPFASPGHGRTPHGT